MLDVATALEENERVIKAENDADVCAARKAGYDDSLVSRLILKPGKASTASISTGVFPFSFLAFSCL